MDQRDTVDTDQSLPRTTTLEIHTRYERSPYFQATLRHGCVGHDVYNHMLLPSRYEDCDQYENFRHLIEHVTLWDVSVEHVVEITGPDARAFTDRLTTRDLDRCAVGQGKYAPLTAANGGIINDPVLLRVDENRFWLCLSDGDAGLWAAGLAHDSEYDVRVEEPPVYPVQVQGPKSKAVIGELFGPKVRDLDYYWCTETELDDIPVVVSRTGWSGEVGYEIYLRDPDCGDELWERVMDAGEPHRIRPIPPSTIRRVEAGIFNYRADMTVENNPLQITGMERLVELDQNTDFIGRDALERINEEGVERKLVGLEIDEKFEEWVVEPWEAYHDGQEVGQVTTATWSPRLERSIGYVWVPIELADPGTRLRLKTTDGETYAGETASLPFYDPGKEIPES